MNQILKFPLSNQSIVPAGQILKVAFQRNMVTAWILTGSGPDQTLSLIPTGGTVDPSRFEYVDSAISDDFVLHVFRHRS